MNIEETQAYLIRAHKQMIDVMNPIIGFESGRVLMVPIEVRPTLLPSLIRNIKTGLYTRIIVGDLTFIGTYLEEDVVRMEFEVGHETGHCFHDVNPKVREENAYIRMEKGDKREMVLQYHELVAEFFATFYFDKTEGIESFLGGRGKRVFRHGKNDEFKFYKSIPSLRERESMCRWLTIRSYEEAERDMRKNPFKDSLRKVLDIT